MKKDFDEIIDDLRNKAHSISMDNEKISELIEEAKEKVENSETLGELSEDIKESIEMIAAWKDKEYDKISQNTILLIIGGLIYIVNPLKIVPKFLKKIPLGEVFVTAYILKKIKDELEEYRLWKTENVTNTEEDDDDNTIYIKL